MHYGTAYASASGAPPPRPERYGRAAMSRRISPQIYASVFGREPDQPMGSPRAMPPQSKVATRGGAFVPTMGTWADPPPHSFESPMLVPSPRGAALPTEDDYRLKLMEAQLRSEHRIKMATLALAADKLAVADTAKTAPASGAFTARF